MGQPSVILLAKQDIFSGYAVSIARSILGDQISVFTGSVGDSLPDNVEHGCDTLVSFLSPWIVPARILDHCGTAINFHPGSVEYPGTGCYNFAIYEGASEFGATCHHMLPKVDTGLVVLERRFPTFANDTVEVLKLRTMTTMLAMFDEIICRIARGEPLPVARTHWTRKAFTKREMEGLKALSDEMPESEIARRVRATVYPGYPGPIMRHKDGSSTAVPVPDRPALA